MTLYILQCYICSQQADNKVYRGVPYLVYAIAWDNNCLLSQGSGVSLRLLLSGEQENCKYGEKSVCHAALKCQRTTTLSLAIILTFDDAVDECWYFVITVLFVKKLFLSIGFSFHLCGWQPQYLFFCLMEILELLVESEVLL